MTNYDAASKSDVDRLTCQGQICENHSMAKLAGGVVVELGTNLRNSLISVSNFCK